MGCIQNKQQILITKKNTNQKNFKWKYTLSLKDKFSSNYFSNADLKHYYKNKSQKLTTQLWIKVFDYLSYKELKETGKVNRLFNKTVKQKEVLIKFFKKRESNNMMKCKDVNFINTLFSFSILQNNKYSSDDDLSYNEYQIIQN